jgi:hypothetical protein
MVEIELSNLQFLCFAIPCTSYINTAREWERGAARRSRARKAPPAGRIQKWIERREQGGG